MTSDATDRTWLKVLPLDSAATCRRSCLRCDCHPPLGVVARTRGSGSGLIGMGYGIRVTVVDDADMPVGCEWAMVRSCGASDLLIAKSHSTEETGLCELLAEAWRGVAHFGGAIPLDVAV